MIREWRRVFQWLQQARVGSVSDPEQRPESKDKQEPKLPRDEKVERMDFLLSLRRRGISDANVLRAMDQVPRQEFVLPDFAAMAYADQAMPIACGQTISQPY